MALANETDVVKEFTEYLQQFSLVNYAYMSVFFILASIYITLTFKSLKNLKFLDPIAYNAQIAYISAVCVKGASYMTCSILFIIPQFPKTNQTYYYHIWKRWNVLAMGTPGYVSAAAYCCIFFSWCNICITYLSKNSKSFYEKSGTFIKVLLVIIFILFISSTSVVVIANVEVSNNAHYFEAGVATFRDFCIGFCFLVYMIHVLQQFRESGNMRKSSPEFRLFVMCVTLILVLFIRTASIVFYTFHYSGQIHEFSLERLIMFAIEQFITELFPFTTIAAVRLFSIDEYSFTPIEYEDVF
ncbi:hypothetical protein TRFO_31331 [Tritrichomonas foetus]|uniref:THH1/TOM1/TOM3 domain-containing protein n=1 Tax=Tritrichomonas foetus TaxID=1144522 RepID=A0A1J4JRI1_9EUKA|nr:hypothetical protein TRFO_31331 [Tritrichomonas foetus]|eukprot:OHT01721.1 hypothetical protein TRFO_31331 [Tritrichomonas foetus]